MSLKYSDEDLLNILRSFSSTPKRRDVRQSTLICMRFGSWNKALIAAGWKVRRKLNSSTDELIVSLKQFYEKYGRAPRAKDTNEYDSLFDYDTYLRGLNCSSWADVLEKAGLPVYMKISEIVKDKDNFEEKLAYEIKKRGIRRLEDYRLNGKGLPSFETLIKRYGSSKEFAEKFGLIYNKIQTKEDFKKELLLLTEQLGHIPSSIEFENHSHLNLRSFRKHIKWNDFLKEMGIVEVREKADPNNYNKDELIEIYRNFSKTIGKLAGATVNDLNNATNIPGSDVFIYNFGSINELRNAAGFPPVLRYPKRYSKDELVEKLKLACEIKGRILTLKEIQEIEWLPSLSTIFRYFKSTSIKDIYKEIMR